ncbi:LamG domain-containing protein [Phocaeicola oris]|uniref:LamG domain-containing protein n=1 Tax=Phocaeicola oris TaxID=2896850 RepID=UPI00234EBFD1|nr:LamG domain-containing protein [Phocaeicola oris]MCE2616929.1 LamG domain-containing protein [Phocaeicola oris]
MKNILTYIGIASLILLTGCANHEVTEQDLSGKTSERTLTLTASMPTESNTRVTMTENDEGNLFLAWKAGDKISLCFVSGSTVKTVSDVPITNIREEGKTADFTFAIPEGITTPFSLYGIYGAGFKADNSSVVELRYNEADEFTLDYASVRSAMRFALSDITDVSSLPSASFELLGSMMKVSIRNTSETDTDVFSFLIIGGKYDYEWTYGSQSEYAEYDLVSSSYVTDNAESVLGFMPHDGKTIKAGTEEIFYRCFVPTETPDSEKTFTIMFNHNDGTAMCELPYKEFVKGKYYRLNLIWDGTNLKRCAMPSASDLIAYWPMDGNVNDVSGNKHHGTIVGGVTLTEDHKGNAGSAYLFNGTDGYIDVGDWENGGAMSFAFWVRIDEYRNYSRLLDFGGPDAFDVYVCLDKGSKVEVFNGSSGTETYSFADVFSGIGLWDYLCISFGSDGILKFYKNGLLLGECTGISKPIKKIREEQYFGKSTYSGSDPLLKGALDDVRMYNRALTAEEVLALYLSTL